MNARPSLPFWETKSYKDVFGALQFGVNDRKLTVVLGDAGSGKSTVLRNFLALDPIHTHYILCSPNTTMKSMLLSIADAIHLHDVKGDSNALQKQIVRALQEDQYHCLVFDESEYLHRGNVSKIDVLRQIYDETCVPIILCGTYKLKELLTGNGKNNHNQPQIFRRLLKAEFSVIKKEEVLSYLSLLEREYAVTFHPDVQAELFALCLDRENGGLGIFIALLELIFSIARPEWRTISLQHENAKKAYVDSSAQAFEDSSQLTSDNSESKIDTSIDVAKLKNVTIDKSIMHSVSMYKMTK